MDIRGHRGRAAVAGRSGTTRSAQARRRLHHAVRASRSSRSTGRPADDPRFERIGWPGEFPYTRGLYATGYRGRHLDHPAVRRLRQRRSRPTSGTR